MNISNGCVLLKKKLFENYFTEANINDCIKETNFKLNF